MTMPLRIRMMGIRYSLVTRPVVWALGFLVVGVLLGTYGGTLPTGILGLVVLLGFCVCGFLYSKCRYMPVFFFVLFLVVGMGRGLLRMGLEITQPLLVQVEGVVLDTGGFTAGGNQRVVARVSYGGQSLRLMVYVRPHLPYVKLGQAVTLTGEIQPLTRAVNPGGYDAFLHLRPRKINGVMWPDVVTLGAVQPGFFVTMRQVRDAAAGVFDAVLPMQEAGIIRSMVLGDRVDLDRDLVETYRVAGIRHILSISGMHVTILTLAVNALLGRILSARRAGLLTLGIMVLYCFMTGAAIATVRAVTMGGVLVFARVLYREYDLPTTISWACIALLVYEQLMIYNVGFQLSFGAVYGIALLTTPLERLLMKARMPAYGKFRNSLAVAMAAAFSTYIVFAHHFYEIPVYSVPANLIVLPLMSLLLVLGVVTIIVGFVWLPAAAIPAGVVYYILIFYEGVSVFFGSLPGALWRTGGGSVPVSLAGVGVLVVFVYVMHGFGADLKRRLPMLFFSVTLLVLVVFIRDFAPRPQVTALYTPGEYIVERFRGNITVTGTGRGGERELLRYLDRRGVYRACTLVLTEWPRTGDATRLAPVMERVRVLYIHGPAMPLPTALRHAVEAQGVEVVFVVR